MNDATIPDETRRRLEVLKSSVDIALKTLEEYDDLLQQVRDGSYRALTTDHVRDIMMVMEYVADGSAYNAYVNGVSVQDWAARLHRLLREEFPDITQY